MTDSVCFVIYQHPPYHPDALIHRCQASLAHESDVLLSQGTPAMTANAALRMASIRKDQWVAVVDPHLIFDVGMTARILERCAAAPARCGFVKFAARQCGPQGKWAPLTKDTPMRAYLLTVFRVSALESCDGFVEADSGRNWLPATEMRVVDQGWTVQMTHDVIGAHDDPSLSMDYWLRQRYWSGRDWASLYKAHKNHGHFPPEVKGALLQASRIDTAERQARCVAKASQYAWLLGAIETLGVHAGSLPDFLFEMVFEEGNSK